MAVLGRFFLLLLVLFVFGLVWLSLPPRQAIANMVAQPLDRAEQLLGNLSSLSATVALPPPTSIVVVSETNSEVRLQPPRNPELQKHLMVLFASPSNATTAEYEVLREEISTRLRRLQELASASQLNNRRIIWHGYIADGILFCRKSDGHVEQITMWTPGTPHKKNSRVHEAPIYFVESFLRSEKLGTRPLFVFYGIHDNDLWMPLRDYPDSDFARELVSVSVKYPNLFWFFFSPSIIDDQRGYLGPRTVAIPHPHIFYYRLDDRAPAWSQRTKGVVGWRGTTTGWVRPYNQSDRCIMVRAFSKLPLSANSDVRFHDRGQGVFEFDIPNSLIGSLLRKDQLLRYKVQLDVDGNSNSWEGFRWKLTAGATVIKVSSFMVQWYYHLLRDQEHVFLHDIAQAEHEKVLANLVENLGNNETLNRIVGRNAECFAKAHLTHVSATAYLQNVIENLWNYSSPRDWRIRPASGEPAQWNGECKDGEIFMQDGVPRKMYASDRMRRRRSNRG